MIGLPYCGQLKDANPPVLRLSMRAPYRWRGRSNNPYKRGNLGTDALSYSRRDLLGVPTCIEDAQMQCLAGIVVALATCPAGTLGPRGLVIDATFLDKHAPTASGRLTYPSSWDCRMGLPYVSGVCLNYGDLLRWWSNWPRTPKAGSRLASQALQAIPWKCGCQWSRWKQPDS